LRIDTRAGSKELFDPLEQLGVKAEPATLTAGDIEIVGNGPDGPLLVGIEYKKLPDLFQCIRNGRFADQLRAMKECYSINWLLIEGRMQGFFPRSKLMINKGKRWQKTYGHITYQEVASWAIGMSTAGGVLCWRTECQEETAAWLRSLNLWWTAKEWDQHRAHLDWYLPPPDGNPFHGPTTLQKVASALPRIGPTKATRVAEHFKTVYAMTHAGVDEWTKIKGIGQKDALTITKAIVKEE